MMKIPFELKNLLSESRHIVLINHWNPDGDAVGSVFALGRVLSEHNHKVSIVMPNAFPSFLNFLSNEIPLFIYDQNKKEADKALEKADLIGILDFNRSDRAGIGIQEWLENRGKTIFMLDHHREPGDFADYTLSYPKVASTCELVYEMCESLDWLRSLDKAAAQALYTGMITDTGSFRFSSVRPKTLQIASDLLEIGAEPWTIHEQIFDQDRESRLRLLGECLAHMKVDYELNAVFMWLDAETLKKYSHNKGDTEGFVNYGLSMQGMRVSVFAIEREDGWKISFRSKGDLDVSLIAREHFDGGGHYNAAGGKHPGDHSNIQQEVWKILSEL